MSFFYLFSVSTSYDPFHLKRFRICFHQSFFFVLFRTATPKKYGEVGCNLFLHSFCPPFLIGIFSHSVKQSTASHLEEDRWRTRLMSVISGHAYIVLQYRLYTGAIFHFKLMKHYTVTSSYNKILNQYA